MLKAHSPTVRCRQRACGVTHDSTNGGSLSDWEVKVLRLLRIVCDRLNGFED
jgi:hypothetical protein